MPLSSMDRPAELVIWRAARTPSAARIYPTLRDALSAASGLAGDAEALPWIVTEDGDILSPHWIDDHFRRAGPAPRGGLCGWLARWI
ncbi:hypothetical protein OPKNFCMD_0038 [Methylobacterium crusticola]|uniref:Uncharacterized protein n=1 Tax=Methylobacterium crusticola TaxID=1697972 RepID=A0ABQ4QRU2_9HYPH|nr:hypothetical protein [Methylobacterium crusticola]GJD47332.1 hypothetical protein OPKNFCMD_0038 [Methylobacterium crusticola]